MKNTHLPIIAAATAFAAALAAPAVQAGPAMDKTVVVEEPAANNPWWFRLAPYAWLTATEGDLTLAGIEVPVDVSFADTLDTLDMTAMGVIEGGYDRFGFGVDVVYGKFSDDARLGGIFFDSVRLEQKQWLATPRVSYRVIETGRYHMDVLAGARWTSLELDFTLRRSGGGQRTIGGSRDWWDPIVGVRGRADLTDKFFLHYSALVGGFGVNSDFLWDAYLGFGYNVTRNLAVALGYRGVGGDYEDGGLGADTIAHGIVLGIEARF